MKLKKTHHDSLVDNLACCPDTMLAKTASPQQIITGFTKPGYVDEVTGHEPSFERLLGTCKRTLSLDELGLVEASFGPLLTIMLEKGHIEESIFDERGFPKDLDMDGDTVERNAGITNEKCRRNCILSHQHVRSERRSEIERHTSNEKRKANDAMQTLRDLHDDSEKCLGDVKLAMGGVDLNIEDATYDHFFKPISDRLKAFIHVRRWPTVKKTGKWPKKGQPADAAGGRRQLD
jgi:hypothetical protein